MPHKKKQMSNFILKLKKSILPKRFFQKSVWYLYASCGILIPYSRLKCNFTDACYWMLSLKYSTLVFICVSEMFAVWTRWNSMAGQTKNPGVFLKSRYSSWYWTLLYFNVDIIYILIYVCTYHIQYVYDHHFQNCPILFYKPIPHM